MACCRFFVCVRNVSSSPAITASGAQVAIASGDHDCATRVLRVPKQPSCSSRVWNVCAIHSVTGQVLSAEEWGGSMFAGEVGQWKVSTKQ